ncbi:tetratricopeptide repeat protein, partial [Candidatus Woesearchaeota archaeon]|nr:tetratricopeptide repeat protein [Candidatus Woesearchaeota archaeon]
GMGVVYTIKDKDVQERRMVMKITIPGKADEEFIERFEEEAEVTGQLTHPGIATVLEKGKVEASKIREMLEKSEILSDKEADASKKQKVLEIIRQIKTEEANHKAKQKRSKVTEPLYVSYFVQKHIDGENLEDVLQKLKDGNKKYLREYSLPKLMNIFQRICETVAYANNSDIVHRDLKPENIMVGPFGEVYVMDWGLAKVRGIAQGSAEKKQGKKKKKVPRSQRTKVKVARDHARSMTGDVMGTPYYMSPEQADGEVDLIDGRSDVFSLGAILYQMATFRKPFEASTLQNIIFAILSKDPASLVDNWKWGHEDANPKILESIAYTALEKEQKDRYPSASDLAKDVERFMGHERVDIHPYGFYDNVVAFNKRHHGRPFLATVITLLLLTAGGGVAAYLSVQKAAAEREAKTNLEGKLEAEKESSKNKELALQKSEEARVNAELAEKNALEAKDEAEKAQKAAEGEAAALKSKADRADAVSLAVQGRVFVTKNNYQKALEYFLAARKADPSFPDAWNGIGEAKFNLGRRVAEKEKRSKLFSEAKSDLEKAIELDNDPEEKDKLAGRAQVHLADVHVGLSNKAEAEKLYREAIAKSPDYITGHYKLARFLCSRRKYDEAIKHYTRITEISKDYWAGWDGLGYIHLKHGRLAEAEKCYHRAKKGHPESYYSLAEIKFRQADWQAANSFLTVLEDVLPGYKTEKRIQMQREVAERLAQRKNN